MAGSSVESDHYPGSVRNEIRSLALCDFSPFAVIGASSLFSHTQSHGRVSVFPRHCDFPSRIFHYFSLPGISFDSHFTAPEKPPKWELSSDLPFPFPPSPPPPIQPSLLPFATIPKSLIFPHIHFQLFSNVIYWGKYKYPGLGFQKANVKCVLELSHRSELHCTYIILNWIRRYFKTQYEYKIKSAIHLYNNMQVSRRS